MARVILSKSAANRAISYSNEAKNELLYNISVMDNEVNSQFNGLQDPTFRKYLELSEQLQDMLKQVCGKMDEISEYCRRVIRWMEEYSNI